MLSVSHYWQLTAAGHHQEVLSTWKVDPRYLSLSLIGNFLLITVTYILLHMKSVTESVFRLHVLCFNHMITLHPLGENDYLYPLTC